MVDKEEDARWYQRFTTARALDRLGRGWPNRTQEEELEVFRARSRRYLKLMLTLDDEQLELLQDYTDTLRDERDFWDRRSFYLGYQAAQEEFFGKKEKSSV